MCLSDLQTLRVRSSNPTRGCQAMGKKNKDERVWLSEEIAIISLHRTNYLAFITETECVYCAVRTQSLHRVQVNLSR